MWKLQGLFLLGLTLFLSTSLSAAEIGTVLRDFEYQNIFMHKTHLIGKPKANVFTFEEDVDTKPEYFRVIVKASKEELGQTIEVVFRYKPHHSSNFKERREKLLLSRRTESVKFSFKDPTEGQIEQWTALILKEDQIVAEQNSSGYDHGDKKMATINSLRD